MLNNFLPRLESERAAAKLRSKKLISLGEELLNHESIKQCVAMAGAEERLSELLQELIDEIKATKPGT